MVAVGSDNLLKRFYKKYIFVLLLVLFVVGLNYYLLDNFLENIAHGLYRAPAGLLEKSFAQLTKYGSGVIGLSRILNENQKLKEENVFLLSRAAHIQKLERDNKFFKEQLAVTSQDTKLLLAKIFSVNRDRLVSSLLIDQGSKNGVKPGLAVVAGGDVLVGVIEEVFADSARVILADDPRSAISVRVGSADIIAVARGLTGTPGLARLELVTNQDKLQGGELVVTSGLDNLTDSLLVGRVKEVKVEGGNLFQDVKIDLLFEPVSHPELFVIIK